MTDYDQALERFEYRSVHAIDPRIMAQTTSSLVMDYARDRQLLQMVHYCYGKRGATISVPRDWWEALKERWFPAWALLRWPVVSRVYEARALLPFLNVPPQERWLTVAQFIGPLP